MNMVIRVFKNSTASTFYKITLHFLQRYKYDLKIQVCVLSLSPTYTAFQNQLATL